MAFDEADKKAIEEMLRTTVGGMAATLKTVAADAVKEAVAPFQTKIAERSVSRSLWIAFTRSKQE